jgi:hypothetical protein
VMETVLESTHRTSVYFYFIFLSYVNLGQIL